MRFQLTCILAPRPVRARVPDPASSREVVREGSLNLFRCLFITYSGEKMCEHRFPLPTKSKVLEAQKIKRVLEAAKVKASVQPFTTDANGQPVLPVIFRSKADMKRGVEAWQEARKTHAANAYLFDE